MIHGKGDGPLQCKYTGDIKTLMVFTGEAGGSKMALGRAQRKKLVFWLGTAERYNGRKYTGRNGNKECRI